MTTTPSTHVRHRRARAALAGLVTLATTVTGLAASQPAGAATVTVCATGCDHTSIAAAVAAAAPGDTVTVAAGTYAETSQILVNKPLTLQGAGSASTVISSTTTSLGVMRVTTASSATFGGEITISGLRLSTRGGAAAHHTGIFVASTSATPGPIAFDDVVIAGKNAPSANESALYLSGAANLVEPRVTFTGGSIGGTAGNGMLGEDWRGGVTIEGSTFTQIGSSPVLYHHMVNNPTDAGFTEQEPAAWVFDDNTIAGQILLRQLNTTVTHGYGPISITDNVITNNRLGGNAIQVNDRSNTSVTITGNTIDNTRANSSGILLDHNGTGSAATQSFTIDENSFANFERAFWTGAGRTRNGTMNRNRVVNTVQGFNLGSSGVTLNASSNWWGCNAGLAATPTRCAERAGSTTAPVTISDWIVASAAVTPATVKVGETAAVTGDLRHLNTGAAITLPPVFEGLATSATATLGTVAPGAGSLTAGDATPSTYTAPTAPSTDAVTVTVDGEPIVVPVTVVRPGISGTVTSASDGSAVAGLQVRLYKDGSTGSAATTTAADGTFSFGNLTTGTYELWYRDVSGDLWVSEYHDDAPTRAQGTPIAFTTGDVVVADEELTPKPPVIPVTFRTIEGTVTDPEGDPIPGIQVRLYKAPYDAGSAATTTDVQGHYEFTRRTAGDYKLWFRDIRGTTWVSTYDGDASTLAESDGVTLTDQANLTVDATLQPKPGSTTGPQTGTIQGTVTGEQGEPAAGVQVRLYPEGSTGSSATTTDANGVFTFSARPVGSYRLWFRDLTGQWVSEYHADAASLETADLVAVDPGQTTVITGSLAPRNPIA